MPIFIATENVDVYKIHEQSESLVKNGILQLFVSENLPTKYLIVIKGKRVNFSVEA